MGGFAPGFAEFEISDGSIRAMQRRDELGLQRAQRQLKILQGRHRRMRVTGLGEWKYGMPAFYYHKLAAWGRLHGYGRNGYAVHDDPELIRDILRKNPELKIECRSDKVRFWVGAGRGGHGQTRTSTDGGAAVRAENAAGGGMPEYDLEGNRIARVLEDRPGRFRKVYPEFSGRKR